MDIVQAEAETAAVALPPARRDRLFVVDDFLPPALAAAMRQDIDNHFSSPREHRANTHQVWNYWHVPGLYSYLRTTPEKVIARLKMERFMEQLNRWSTDTLGLTRCTWPHLSLYLPGCRQNLHNDAVNGRFGFVYSLTKDERKTLGGQTIVHKEGDPFRYAATRASAGHSFYDLVEPKFNRLILFDDRLPHAVEMIEGSMDAREGRLVIHGHIREAAPKVTGALPAEAVTGPALQAVEAFTQAWAEPLAAYNGPVTFRIDIRPDGQVAQVRTLLDRVIHPDADDRQWPPLLTDLIARLSRMRLPSAEGPSRLVLPVLFGPYKAPI
jgi:Rps23 Pro-64 3,4-dihydroxylase Tpa1-like proline 4-hydroxylase